MLLTLYEYICIPTIASVSLYFVHDTIITTQTLGSERIRYIDEITLKGIIKCCIQHTHYTYEHNDTHTRQETLDKINRRFGDNKTQYCSQAHTHTRTLQPSIFV